MCSNLVLWSEQLQYKSALQNMAVATCSLCFQKAQEKYTCVDLGHFPLLEGIFFVLMGQGWRAWAPGVHFHGAVGEQVFFTLGSTSYKATFESETGGSQTNLSTGT